jgi:hypothetical protein
MLVRLPASTQLRRCTCQSITSQWCICNARYALLVAQLRPPFLIPQHSTHSSKNWQASLHSPKSGSPACLPALHDLTSCLLAGQLGMISKAASPPARLPTAAVLFDRAVTYDRNWETVYFRYAAYLDQLMTDAKRRQEGSDKTNGKVKALAYMVFPSAFAALPGWAGAWIASAVLLLAWQ